MSDTADPAARLSAALERIASLSAGRVDLPADPDPVEAEITAGLDSLIARLRSALGPVTE